MRRALLAIAMACCAAGTARAEAQLQICAEHADPEDWDAEFHTGSVLVPAGTIFDYAGHLMGDNLQDPKDWAHWDAGKWKGLSKEEEERRSKLTIEDAAINQKQTSGVVTTDDVRLTKSRPCALAAAKAVVSEQWGWATSPIVGDSTLYYQAYGILQRGAVDTSFSDDNVPLNYLAARGELNASVVGTITQTLRLDEWSASQGPDELPVQGKGNSECWGNDSRQDISCRALTEKFLSSMRHATKDEVVRAMNVTGRKLQNELHFISNYSRGERWGSGMVNFTFDDDGRVSVITAIIDPPNSNGKSADYIWNSKLLPEGCSDLAGGHMDRCDDARTLRRVEAHKRLLGQ